MEFSKEDYVRAKKIIEKARKALVEKENKLTLEELACPADPYQRVAHILAKKTVTGVFPIDRVVKEEDFPEALAISNDDGWSVAHELAFHGYPFKRSKAVEEKLLSLKTVNEGVTPLHVLAQNYPILFIQLFTPQEKEYYLVSDNFGLTPAHVIVYSGFYPFTEEDREILTTPAGINGPTPLEIAVVKGLVKEIKSEELKNTPLTVGVTAGEYLEMVNFTLSE